MIVSSTRALNCVAKHLQADRTHYIDLGKLLETDDTVASATVQTNDDDLVLGSVTVLASDTTVKDFNGESHLIEASTGVKFNISAGTVGEWLVTCVFTTAEGQIDAVDCEIIITGQAAAS